MFYYLSFFSFIVLFITNFHGDLFKKYPELAKNISHINLCKLPTPVEELLRLSEKLDFENNRIFVKRDDLSGSADNDTVLYGGNKPRKLEFILADAKKKKADEIITFGGAGSNHAVATACYSQYLGLQAILLLKKQEPSAVVKQNLLLDLYYGALLKPADEQKLKDAVFQKYPNAYHIPVGGSNALGAIGFVNAAFELKSQIERKEIPEPHLIYLPIGSVGTTAGLLLGLQLAGIKNVKIVAVSIYNNNNLLNILKALFQATNEKLHTLDWTIPLIEFPDQNIIINTYFNGVGYGVLTPEVKETIQLMKDAENIQLEQTYTGKCLAAMIYDLKNNKDCQGKNVLLWNTFCGKDFSQEIGKVSFKDLPEAFQIYFKNE